MSAERSEASVASSRGFIRLRLQNDSDGTLALEERSRQRVVWLLFARLVVHAALAGKARLNAHDVQDHQRLFGARLEPVRGAGRDDDGLVLGQVGHDLFVLAVEDGLAIQHDPGRVEPGMRVHVGLALVRGNDLYAQVQHAGLAQPLAGLALYDHRGPDLLDDEWGRGLNRG